MARTHDVGPLFFHVVRIETGTPLFHRGTTQEISPPFRCSRPLCIRIPGLRCLVVGWWHDSGIEFEEEAVLKALDGFGIEFDWEQDLEDNDVVQMIRERVADHAGDVDEEWTILEAVGMFE